MPSRLRAGGKTVAGFAAFKGHLSYLPFSGSVIGPLAGKFDGYTMAKSALTAPSTARRQRRS